MNERILDADVGIVGAGPGGMAAAVELARAGLRVVVLDEGARPGGQIFRQLPVGAASGKIAEPPSHHHGHELLQQFGAGAITVCSQAVVWNAQPGRLWFQHEGVSWLLRCRRIVLAPGAYDRCIPFPGWTLPGVITAGAAQVMVRGFGIRPGQRALVAGTGPLLLPTVTALLAAGVRVVAALEAAPRLSALKALPGVFGNGARLREAFWYARQLLRRGVRLSWSSAVFACEGDGAVQRAVIGKVDRQGRPRRETARTLEVDVVCAGFGLVPSIELGQLLGCAIARTDVRGGWCVTVDELQRTSVPSVFAVGEICGIGGGEVAMAEGRLAASAVVFDLRGGEVAAALRARVRSERKAADAMLRAFPPLPGLYELADANTIVCRCEDVSLARAREAAELHGRDARGIKMGCRAGMGPCQARICGPSLQAMACGDGRVPMDAPVVQVPVKAVSVGTILAAPKG